MPKQGLTEIVAVIDKSGSMDAIREDAMGAFNRFLSDQKNLPGEATFTLTLFDTNYNIVHARKPIKDVPELIRETYVPSGFTALTDAVGRTIDEVGKRLFDTPEPERPERVVMVIVTDGQENSSKEYSRQTVLDKIEHQTNVYQWEFVFLAAGPDAMKEAQRIGIKLPNVVAFAANDGGAYVRKMRSLSSNVGSYRRGLAPDWQADSHDA